MSPLLPQDYGNRETMNPPSGSRSTVITLEEVNQILHPNDARIRPANVIAECERWVGPETTALEAYPWDHTKQETCRLTYYSANKGRSLTAEDLDPWLKHIQYMMFSQGDSSEPLLECKMFMVETVWQQMNVILKRCWKRAQDEGRTLISFEDVVYQMRNNVHRINRLIGYNIREQKCTSDLHRYTAAKRPLVDLGDEILEILRKYKPEAYAEAVRFKECCNPLYEAVVNVNEEFLLLCNERRFRYTNRTHRNRKRRLRSRVQFLDDIDKEILETAQLVAFTSRSGRRSAFFAERFHGFLGRPPLETDVIYSLDFLAYEIVAELVEGAVKLRDLELEAEEFDDVWQEGEDVIQIRHYEKAYQQHPGVVKNNDVLFGADKDEHISWEERVQRRREQERSFQKAFIRKQREMRHKKYAGRVRREREERMRLWWSDDNRENRMAWETREMDERVGVEVGRPEVEIIDNLPASPVDEPEPSNMED